MNTLNPEREIELNRQMDDARLSRRGELDTARASRTAPALAPTPAATAPATPALNVGAITGETTTGAAAAT